MVNTISSVIENLGYDYQILVDDPTITVFRMAIALEHAKTDCIIDVRIPDKIVAVFIISPVSAPESGRKRVSEFLTMANYGLILGGFEMDMDDGELRYKSSFIYENEVGEEYEFKQHLFNALYTMDRYFPGIMAVLFTGLEPRVAISQINNYIDPKMN
jgi:hypothetical protein